MQFSDFYCVFYAPDFHFESSPDRLEIFVKLLRNKLYDEHARGRTHTRTEIYNQKNNSIAITKTEMEEII